MLSDSVFKVPKVMKNMFSAVSKSPDSQSGIKVSGFLVSQMNMIEKVMNAPSGYVSTLDSRHAGSMEAESLGMPNDTIKRGGGWKDRLGRLETHYLNKVPSEFARGMAGFWAKPFGLERNRVDPPVEIQKLVFPWIEGYFGDDAAWKQECMNEMRQVDESEFHGEETLAEFVEEDVEEDNLTDSQRRKGKQREVVAVHHSLDAAKRGFLKLLIRCRRIILQDAAVFLIWKKENDVVNSLPSLNNFFLTEQFQQFQAQIKVAINTPTNDRLQEYENLVPHIVDSHNEVSSRLAGFDQQLLQIRQDIQQDTRPEILELKHHNFTVNSKMDHLQQQLQHCLSMQQLILTNIQFLTSQLVESIVAPPSNPAVINSTLPPSQTVPVFSPAPAPIFAPAPASIAPTPVLAPSPFLPSSSSKALPTTTANKKKAHQEGKRNKMGQL
ncbi:unnamed protein product [Mucor hiemalis]